MKESYFRIKMSFSFKNDQGKTEKAKTEDIVYAVNYMDAEKVAYALIKDQHRDEVSEPEYEIQKTKIADLHPSKLLIVDHDTTLAGLVYASFDNGEYSCDGLYQVKVNHEDGLDKDGEPTFKNETVWVIGKSSDHTTELAMARFDGCSPKIKEVKFDKAESIIVPKTFFELPSED